MDKASGVYLTITDNSIVSSGTTELKILIPMLTTKGEIGLNTVTADTMESVLGYDLKYNPNYYGLKQILENVSYAKVWRLNQEATLSNVYALNKTSGFTHMEDIDSFDTIKTLKPLVGVSELNVGKFSSTLSKVVKFEPIENVEAISNTGDEQVIAFESNDVSDITETYETETYEEGIEILSGMKIYNASNNSLIGVIEVVDGSFILRKIVDDEIVTTTETDPSTGEEVVTKAEYGTAERVDDKFKLTITKKLSSDSFYNFHTFPMEIEDWNLIIATKSGETYTELNEVEFSFDTESDNYWENIDFSSYDIQVYFSSNIPSDMSSVRDWIELEGGSNGLSSIAAIDIDTTFMEKADCNIILMNGLGATAKGYQIVNRIGKQCDRLKMHLFVDTPIYENYIDVREWQKKIVNSQYVAIASRADQATDSDDNTIYVHPSVNYAYIFSNMMNTYGNLNYPPAGFTYGKIVANDLIDTDFELYANELKTYRINWQRVQNEGASMWEQRTTYSLNSDLSYIAPTFILDELTDQLVSFERNYNFRYMTSTDLLNQESGLTKILQSMEDDGFIYDYELSVPTFEEAQAAGRTLDISVSIKITKDSEVININLTLNS